jgi:SAM-dependent methyltransferase
MEEKRGAHSAAITLRCPRCGAEVPALHCLLCGFAFHSYSGIVHALPPERVVHYARFTEDYERIRIAEGRASDDPEFYLNLPYRDLTGKNSRQWRIRSRSFDELLNRILRPRIRTGNILDLGAGNCWMSYRLSLAGYKPVAVDLLTSDHDGLGAAKHYLERLPMLFPRFRAEYSHLPFRSNQFDAVIFNASFHYAEDFRQVLREALRCTKVDGIVVISDTPWYSCEAEGEQMLAERWAAFRQIYGTASNSLKSLEYLTDERLQNLADQLSIRWQIQSPRYGALWSLRPILAKIRRRREPAKFRIYVAGRGGF